MCSGQFYIEGDLPYRDVLTVVRGCGFTEFTSKDSVFIRQGVSTRSKTLNKRGNVS